MKLSLTFSYRVYYYLKYLIYLEFVYSKFLSFPFNFLLIQTMKISITNSSSSFPFSSFLFPSYLSLLKSYPNIVLIQFAWRLTLEFELWNESLKEVQQWKTIGELSNKSNRMDTMCFMRYLVYLPLKCSLSDWIQQLQCNKPLLILRTILSRSQNTRTMMNTFKFKQSNSFLSKCVCNALCSMNNTPFL